MESPLLNKIDQHFLIPLAVQWLEKMSRGTVMAIGFILLAGIAWVDYATGVTVSMAPFYLLPIGLIALRWGWIVSFLMSALSGVVWFLLIGVMPSVFRSGLTPGTLQCGWGCLFFCACSFADQVGYHAGGEVDRRSAGRTC